MRRSLFWSALCFALLGAALVLLTRIVIVPWVESADGWVVPRDAFVPLNGARYVANGAAFQLYDGNAGTMGYPYPPGLPLLLAWVPWIGDRLGLLGDVTFTRRHPTMFLLLGPAMGFVGTLPLLYAAGKAVQDAARERVVQLQGWIFLAMGFAPIGFFHPEDTIACACVMGACVRTRRSDWRSVGALLGLALLFKQWALWPALPVLFAAPRGKRALTSFYALGIPALVMVPFLLSTPSTWDALTGAVATLHLGHPQVWLHLFFDDGVYGNANVLRFAWGASSVALALWVVRRERNEHHTPSVDSLLAAAGTVMLLRLCFEPTIFGYYVVPPAVFAIVWAARNGRPIALRAITAVLLAAFCLPHTFPEPVFWAVFAGGLAYVCGPMVQALTPISRLNTEPRRPSSRISSEIGSV